MADASLPMEEWAIAPSSTPLLSMVMSVPDPVLEFKSVDPSQESQQSVSGTIDWRWLRVEEFFRSRELAPNTLKAYERDLRQFILWTDKPWHAVTSRDVDRFKEHLQQRRSADGNPLKAATINRSLSALQAFFKWLTVRDYINKNPTQTLEKPKADPIESRELTDKEVKALHAVLVHRGEQEARDTALLWVLEHGLRASEVSALNIQDYDGMRVHIRAAKADSVGTVPLAQEARWALDAYLGWRLRQRLPIQPESPLFLSSSNNSKGERLSYWGIYKIIEALAELAGVENCHPHRLRHTFATQLVLKRMDTALARTLTRHKSEASFRRYSKRAMEVEAERQFYEVFGEKHSEGSGVWGN